MSRTKPQLKSPILKRWAEVVLASCCMAPLVTVVAEFSTTTLFNRFSEFWQNEWILPVWSFVLGCFFLRTLHIQAGFKSGQLRSFHRFPGFPVVVAISLLVVAIFGPWISDFSRTNRDCVWIIAGTYCLSILIPGMLAPIQRGNAPNLPRLKKSKPLPERDIKELAAWFDEESEIVSSSEDEFGYTDRARRLLKRLQGEKRQCIAIIAPYGAGKSSLINLIKAEAELQKEKSAVHPELLFCLVNCWGVEGGTRGPEVILDQVLKHLNEKVDCLSISSIPRRYSKSLAKFDRFINLAIDLSTPEDPVEELQKISAVLRAMQSRLVVVLEDLDRNGEIFSLHEIEGLLSRLRSVNEISFIISASPRAKIDYNRLVEHSETLPRIPIEKAYAIAEKVWTIFADDENVMISRERSRFKKIEDDINEAVENALGDWGLMPKDHWRNKIFLFLDTPRSFKATLRRFATDWKILQGEVDIDQLLVASALRVRAPHHFSFLQRHWRDFDWLIMLEKDQTNPTAEALRKEWDSLEDFDADPLLAKKFMVALYRPLKVFLDEKTPWSLESKQGVYGFPRGHIYSDRIFNGAIPSGQLLDQDVLRFIEKANREEKFVELANYIGQSSTHLDHFEYFRDARLEQSKLLAVLSALFNQIRTQNGIKAQFQPMPGLRDLYNTAFHESKVGLDDYSVWLQGEVRKSFPNNLRFARDLIVYQPAEFRQKMWDISLSYLASDFSNGKSNLENSLDSNDCTTLFWLIPESAEVSSWFGPLISKALIDRPDLIVPEIVFLITQKMAGEGDTGHPPKLELNETRIKNCLGNFKNNILASLIDFFHRNGSWSALDGRFSSGRFINLIDPWVQKHKND